MGNASSTLAALRERRDYQGVIDRIPYTAHLGIRVETARADGPVFVLPFRQDLVGNPRLPAIHGGAVAALMEAAALVVTLVDEAQSRLPKPIDFSLDYLRSARAEPLYAACEVLRQGRRVVAVRVDAWQEDREHLTASGRAHLLLASGG
ncbi:MAG: PaaI family thioesterase [Algiphilus sp.]